MWFSHTILQYTDVAFLRTIVVEGISLLHTQIQIELSITFYFSHLLSVLNYSNLPLYIYVNLYSLWKCQFKLFFNMIFYLSSCKTRCTIISLLKYIMPIKNPNKVFDEIYCWPRDIVIFLYLCFGGAHQHES